MIRLKITWNDNTTTVIAVIAFDDYWVNEAGELRVWFSDSPSVMETMSIVKKVEVIK